MLLQLLSNGLVNGCLYALGAVGFALIYNTTRVFHVAHGAIYVASAYVCYCLLSQLALPTPLAVIGALLAAALLGFAAEWAVYAPLARRDASLLVALLSSLGLYIVLVNGMALLFGNDVKVLRPGVEQTVRLGPVVLTHIQVAHVVTFCLFLPSLLLFLRKTRWGNIIRAVRDNPTLVQVMGIKLSAVRLLAFGLGSVLAGGAAVLSALDVGIDPNMGMPALLTAAVALIVGGVGTFEGPVIGAFVLGVLQSLVIWKLSARWMQGATFVLLILFLLFRPTGLLGRRRRAEETGS